MTEGEVVIFRSQEFPSNYRFFPEYEEEPEEMALVGIAVNYIVNQNGGKIPNEVLLWSQGGVISMTREKYLKKGLMDGTETGY